MYIVAWPERAGCHELDGEVVDQAAVNEGRFTLFSVDAVQAFGDDLYLEVKLWDRRLRVIASESLYADDDGAPGGDDEPVNGAGPSAG